MFPDSPEFLADPRWPDPDVHKRRIQDTKGPLLRVSRLLWIKGGPGKGKTMLLCGIVDELTKMIPENGWYLSFFFCQGTDSRLNNATAVLTDLIYRLVKESPLLLEYVQEKYGNFSQKVFENADAFYNLSHIITDMLQHPTSPEVILVIDALDECETDLSKLLRFIVEISETSSHVKWVVSSREENIIENQLTGSDAYVTLALERNEEVVSEAIRIYIDDNIRRLTNLQKENDVRRLMQEKAKGTFLWVSLACKELKELEESKGLQYAKLKLDPLRLLEEIPSDLEELLEDTNICWSLLSIVTLAYRPLHILELGTLSNLARDISEDAEIMRDFAHMCGSFLTTDNNGYVHVVHQSAKDYLLTKGSAAIFPFGKTEIHYSIFSRSLDAMSRTLKRNIYGLRHPGLTIDEFEKPEQDPLFAVRYSCIYWVDHLRGVNTDKHTYSLRYQNDISDNGKVHQFLQSFFLNWLEALSLLKCMSEGVTILTELQSKITFDGQPELHALVFDAKRFTLNFRSTIEKAHLQVYSSALIFSPTRSPIRKRFFEEVPTWIKNTRFSEQVEDWNSCLCILEGRIGLVSDVAFAPDSNVVASAGDYDDGTVRLWDSTTGAVLHTLGPHPEPVEFVAYSPDGTRLAGCRVIWIYDPIVGRQLHELRGHTDDVCAFAFLPDCTQLVTGSEDNTVRFWNSKTGAQLRVIQNINIDGSHHLPVAFSPDGSLLATASSVGSGENSPNNIIQLWDLTKGTTAHCTLKGHTSEITALVFSPDGKRLASGSWVPDGTVRLWDIATETVLHTSHIVSVTELAFSPDGSRLASSSSSGIVWLLDATTGATQHRLNGHTEAIRKLAFSPNGRQLASASGDCTIRVWDTVTEAPSSYKGVTLGTVEQIIVSPDGVHLASLSECGTTQLWSLDTWAMLHTMADDSHKPEIIAFSSDGTQLASLSLDCCVWLWDLTTGLVQSAGILTKWQVAGCCIISGIWAGEVGEYRLRDTTAYWGG
ncbi:WD40-repeat-containing domain protein [Xylaria longipes]|nr:WD40-repeat-containing domain protein [Xylaria longipes]